MPYRKEVLVTDEIYHVFNRSVNRQPIFHTQRECQRFYDLIDFYRFSDPKDRFSHYNRLPLEARVAFFSKLKSSQARLVDILAFSIMPNHYHLILRQLQEGGLSSFSRKIQNGFAKYYNIKSGRFGSVFQAMFKAVRVETEDQLIHVVRYTHLNPVTGFILRDVAELITYPWTSFSMYMNDSLDTFIETKTVLSQFSTKKLFREFTFDQADYQRTLAFNAHLLHDPDV